LREVAGALLVLAAVVVLYGSTTLRLTFLTRWLGRFRPARDLACHAERVEESRLQIDASSKAEQPSQTFTRHQHKIVTRPFYEPA